MSDSGYTDDLLEKELFGGDSDAADGGLGMDVDGILGMDTQTDMELEPMNDLGLGLSTDTGTPAKADEEAQPPPDASAAETKKPALAAPAIADLDIAWDTPPGSITMLDKPARARQEVDPKLKDCAMYDIVPTMAFLNAYQMYAVSATADMRWMFTGGEDGYIKKWDVYGTLNRKLMLTQGQRHSMVDSVVKNGVLASYWDHSDVADEQGTEILSPVYSLAVHSQAMWLVSGMKSGNIGLWTVRHDEGRRVVLLKKHKKPVSVLRVSPDEHGMVSGSWDRAALYWDLDLGRVSRGFAGHVSQISAIEFQPQPGGNLLTTASIDGQCLLWDVRRPQPLERFVPAHRTPPWATSCCWSLDGSKLYIGRRNNTVDEYSLGDSRPVRTLRFPMNSGPVTALAMMPNGRSLVCASTDNVRIWDLEHSPETRGSVPFQIVPGHHGGCISGILVSEDARCMVTSSGNRGWEGGSTNVCLGYEIAPGAA
ncbi:Transcription factor spt8 [Coemansia sp. Benny D115]|nr:Transcription factor spt8 [Coemansia sp. Benny D115]